MFLIQNISSKVNFKNNNTEDDISICYINYKKGCETKRILKTSELE